MSESLYDAALQMMETTLHALARRIPQPRRVPFGDSFAYRYAEKSLHQALIQKTARCVTTLHAARLLMEHGFVQEQAALQRVLDEITEDITFLSFAVIFDKMTPLHTAYLSAFYSEDFDAATGRPTAQNRQMVPRQKIRAYIAKAENWNKDPSRGVEIARTVSKTYSGYVHAASPQIMDMYGGTLPHFYLRGMLGTSRHEEHRKDFWNYVYRGLLAMAFTAKTFGEDAIFESIRGFSDKFARSAGQDYGLYG